MHTGTSNSREAVVVLHGFGASPRWMLPLCRRITQTDRRVVNFGYASWRHTIDFSAERLIHAVDKLNDQEHIDQIHFIAYSMGSIICRAAFLKKGRPAKLGRVVMLGPPNRGSHVASFFSPLVGRFVPAVNELSTRPHSYVNGLPRLSGIEVGIIAAQHDRVVKSESTHLPCQREHLLVQGGHAGLLFRRDVAHKALQFLETGSFGVAPERASGGAARVRQAVSPLGSSLVANHLRASNNADVH